jgi:hypothetical protein
MPVHRLQDTHKVASETRCLNASLRANGSRECAPDDRLREAIHVCARG